MSVSKLSEEVSKQGVNLEVITTTANGHQELPDIKISEQMLVDGVPVTYYPRITKDHTHFSPSLLSALTKKIGNSKLTNEQPILHIHAWWNLVSIFSAWIARWKKVPVIISPRGTLSSYSFGNKNSGIKDYIHKFLGKRLLEYSYFHVTSDKEKRDVERLINPRGVFVIPNFVRIPGENDGEVIRQNAEKKADSLKLLFISRVEEKKGLELLFDSLKDFRAVWHLDIAGSGEESYVQKLKLLADEYGLSSKITWLGHVNNEQKFKVMAEHDVMVLPSFDENFANVVVECLSVGTAVLLSENVGLSEYVTQENLGWICERTRADLLSKLEDILSGQKKLESIRTLAPGIIRGAFNEAALTQKYIAMYLEVLSLENKS